MSRRGPARSLWPTLKAYAALGAPAESRTDDLGRIADELAQRYDGAGMATTSELDFARWLLERIVAEPELLEQLCRVAWTRPGGAA